MADREYHPCPACGTLYTEEHRYCPGCTRCVDEQESAPDRDPEPPLPLDASSRGTATGFLCLSFFTGAAALAMGIAEQRDVVLVLFTWGIAATLFAIGSVMWASE